MNTLLLLANDPVSSEHTYFASSLSGRRQHLLSFLQEFYMNLFLLFLGNVNSWDVGSPDKKTHSILSLWSVHLHNNCVIWDVIINHFCAKFFSWSMEKSFVCVLPWSLIISCTTNQLNCQKRLRRQTIFQWHCNTLKIFWSWLCMCHLGWSKVNGWGNDGTS